VSRRGFALGLAAIAVAAFAVRLAYALALVRSAPLVGDALEFHLQANALADGKGYIQVLGIADPGRLRPTADKPPLFPLLEAAVSVLGGRSWAWHHLVGVLAGTGTTVVVGLLGRRAGGPRVGLLAAGIAAVYPVLVETDGSLRSESVYALAVALVLLAALRTARRALVPLVPIALATGWSALVLFCLRIPLNPMSVTLGALVVAISTEFSVLLAERFRAERRAGLDERAALARTYRSTGAAVFASGMTAIAGFAVLTASDIRMLRSFGWVTVVDLTVALIGVLVVLPSVLVLAERGPITVPAVRPAAVLRRLRARRAPAA
jgi:hypothetical protein